MAGSGKRRLHHAPHLRRCRLAALALVFALLLPASACRRADDPKARAAGPATARIGIALDKGSPEAAAYKALGLAGLREVAAACSGRIMDDPDRTDYGDRVELSWLESRIQGQDREQLLRVLADSGCTLVFGIGAGFAEPVSRLAPAYPAVHFVIVDNLPTREETAPNVVSLVFAEADGAFLAGSLAGLAVLDKPGAKVGFIGGVDNAATHAQEAGFIAGAATSNPALRRPGSILVQYCGRDTRALADPGTAAAIAQTMYKAGAEIIYHDAGLSGAGLFEAARVHGKLALGSGYDEALFQGAAEASATGASGASTPSGEMSFAILSSMQKRVDQAIFLLSREFLDTGTLKPGHRTLSVAEGGVDLVVNNLNRARFASFRERLDTIEAGIATGSIRVPTDGVQAAQYLKDLR